MFRSQFFCFVVIFFILINTDLSEAYGSWSDRRRLGLEIAPYLVPVGTIGGVILIFCCCYCCCCYRHEYDEAAIDMQRNIVMEQNWQHQRNNVNETAINLQPSIPQATNQFQENLPQNTYYDAKLSSTHLPYPIAPRNIPSGGPNQSNYIILPEWPSAPENHNLSANDNEQNGSISSSTHRHYDPNISETISPLYFPRTLPMCPSAPENHNLSANDSEQNGLISSSTHLPYPIAIDDDPPPPYPGTLAWINGSWVTSHM